MTSLDIKPKINDFSNNVDNLEKIRKETRDKIKAIAYSSFIVSGLLIIASIYLLYFLTINY